MIYLSIESLKYCTIPEIWKWIKYGIVDHEPAFKKLIEDGFFPIEDVTEKLFGIAVMLIDSKFYHYKFKYFGNLTSSQKMTIKYMVRFFEKKMCELEFEPDDAYGCRKTRQEEGMTNARGALLVYGWLWNKYCV